MTAGRGDVLLVGSLPFGTAEEAMRACATGLGRHAAGFPDGEVGPRSTWIGFLIGAALIDHPQLEPTAPLPTELHQPRTEEEKARLRRSGVVTFRVKPGERLRFDDLHYGRFAVESYATLGRLREEGVAPREVRFQVCLPAPNSVVMSFFADPAQWSEARRAYLERMEREVAVMLEAIPPADLTVQWDVCFEIMDLSTGEEERYYAFWPPASLGERFEQHAQTLGELAGMVPAEAHLGFHWCYGTWGGWPMTAMEDLAVCVRMSNEAVRRSPRRVDYVHMPVIREPEDDFFAPLRDLAIGSARVFLGLVHHTDGVEGFRRRTGLARHHLDSFGISSVCGYGRVDPAELPRILAVHRDCAVDLARATAR